MAQSGYTPIQLYHSATASAAPVAGNLADGELAINTNDGILYYKDSGGVVRTLASKNAAAGTFSSVTITGGSINGTTIGTTTAAAGAFTTLSASSTVTLSGGTVNGVAYLNAFKQVTSGSALTFDGTNLGLGTATPSAYSGWSTLTLNGATQGGEIDFKSAGTLVGYLDANATAMQLATNINIPIQFSINNTEQMRLTSTGLGIGTSSPSQPLQVTKSQNASTWAYVTNGSNDSGAATGLLFGTDQGTSGAISQNSSGNTDVAVNALRIRNLLNAPISFEINSSERMRLDSSGNLLVGTTSAYVSSRFRVKSTGTSNATYNCELENSAGTVLFAVRDDGYMFTGQAAVSPYNATTGSAANCYINSDGGLYRSTSSLKYKTNVQDAIHGLADVLKLRAVTYEGKSESDAGKIFGGLIAEEVHDIGLTEFVQYNNEGQPDALAYSNMVSLAFKAIQEQQAIIESLTARITTLEAK